MARGSFEGFEPSFPMPLVPTPLCVSLTRLVWAREHFHLCETSAPN